MDVYTYVCYLKNSAKHFSNLMNLGEIFIFLYPQLGSGKRLFITFWHNFDNKKDLAFRFKRNISNVYSNMLFS